jgi:acyl carrier protein
MTHLPTPSTIPSPAPSRDSIMDQLRTALISVTEGDPSSVVLAESTRLREDLGLDSFAALELIFELEEQAGVRISQEVASSFQTVGDVVSYVLTQLSAEPSVQAEARGRAGAP